MKFITTEEKEPETGEWYLVKTTDYSESDFEIAKWDGAWLTPLTGEITEYVDSYHPTPLSDI